MVNNIFNNDGITGAEIIREAYAALAERGEEFTFLKPLETLAYVSGEQFAPNSRGKHMVYKEGVILDIKGERIVVLYGEKKNEAGHMFQNDISAVVLPEGAEMDGMLIPLGDYFTHSLAHSRCLGEIVIGEERVRVTEPGRDRAMWEPNDYFGDMRMFFLRIMQSSRGYVLSQNNMSARYAPATSELLASAILKTLEKAGSRVLCPA